MTPGTRPFVVREDAVWVTPPSSVQVCVVAPLQFLRALRSSSKAAIALLALANGVTVEMRLMSPPASGDLRYVLNRAL